jgi:hypothetical protein
MEIRCLPGTRYKLGIFTAAAVDATMQSGSGRFSRTDAHLEHIAAIASPAIDHNLSTVGHATKPSDVRRHSEGILFRGREADSADLIRYCTRLTQ